MREGGREGGRKAGREGGTGGLCVHLEKEVVVVVGVRLRVPHGMPGPSRLSSCGRAM